MGGYLPRGGYCPNPNCQSLGSRILEARGIRLPARWLPDKWKIRSIFRWNFRFGFLTRASYASISIETSNLPDISAGQYADRNPGICVSRLDKRAFERHAIGDLDRTCHVRSASERGHTKNYNYGRGKSFESLHCRCPPFLSPD